jgi:nitrite reductase/ring-hydroxylating ferredoxin subunit
MAFEKVADLGDLAPEVGYAARAGGRAVVVFLVGDRVHALEDRCPHRDARLSEGGWAEDGAAICPLHHARFDLSTGRALCEPAGGDIRAYPARIVGEAVEVDAGD